MEDPKEAPKGPHRKNTYPMLVLPLRKIFVPSVVAVSYTHLDVYKRQVILQSNNTKTIIYMISH